MTLESVRGKAITLVQKNGTAAAYNSSVLVPIRIIPTRPGMTQSEKLVGVMSLDSELKVEQLRERKPALKLVVTLGGLVRRTIEALDLAFYDFLGGDVGILSNAFYFKKLTSLSEHDLSALKLSYFDLNNFKSVNDEHDHKEGDHVLREFGKEVMKRCEEMGFNDGFWLCRFGGDEFGLVVKDAGISIETMQKSLRDKLLNRFQLCRTDNQTCSRHPVTPSIGLASWSKAKEIEPDGSLCDVAVRLREIADDAMYAAKRIYKELPGEKTWVVIAYDLNQARIESIKGKTQLKRLLEQNSNGAKSVAESAPKPSEVSTA